MRMGWETACVHLGTRDARKHILRDLRHRKSRWLKNAAEDMAENIEQDWRAWQRHTS
jgi:hypothetical protein